MFKPVPNKVDFVAQEKDILAQWHEQAIFDRLRQLRKDGPLWSFIDGPITANNPMGVHHAWGRTYKDLFHRYKAMQGYQTRYQNGFDCQGLWVEVNVEKDLGFETKRDIEQYGLEKFVTDCKHRVLTYAAVQTEQSIRLGYWMDWNDPQILRTLAEKLKDNPQQEITVQGANGPITDTVEGIVGRLGDPDLGGSYFTFSDENNYTIWAVLKKCHDQGWIYKGTDVMPWCARCGTGLSQHEIVTEGYQELTHTSVYLLFPLVDSDNEHLLVWTTTPWTLTSNVAAAVNPDLTYALVEQGERKIWLAKGAIANAITSDHKVLAERPGKELIGRKYRGPFDELEAVMQSGAKEQHQVIPWDGVDEEEGTGIVHIAPGCGAEDYELGQTFALPILAPLDEIGTFVAGFGPFSQRNVHTIAEDVFSALKAKDILYRKQKYRHRYPTCWRCSEELVFRLVDEWYISMGEQTDKPLEQISSEEKAGSLRLQMMDTVAKHTQWYPRFGLSRELDWLKNMHDWMISKKRFWGLALPIYECKECNRLHVIGSKEELKQLAVEGWSEFEGRTPHRPWIDAVKIGCQGCGAVVSRVPDVGNPWLDAGIVAMSTLQYRTNREYWQKWFPADLISESFPGQFRNWFYSMIAMSTVLEGRAPFNNVFSYSTLLAEDGSEMHKSKGNAIWFEEAADKMGVDVMRWMYSATRPEQNLLFGYGKADDVRRLVLLPLWNMYSFFVTYANLDRWTPNQERPDHLALLDRWILSRLQQLIKDVSQKLDGYDPQHACSAVERFLDDLSNWYIRRSRRRFWRSELDSDKQAAYYTLYRVLLTISKLTAPFMPFVSDAIYCNLAQTDAKDSVHLQDWPQVEEDLIDKDLNETMAFVRQIVNNAHAARSGVQIKVRQPLQQVFVVREGNDQLTEELASLIKDEINVKEITFVVDANQLVDYEVLPNFRTLGPRYGKQINEIKAALATADSKQLAAAAATGTAIDLQLADGTTVHLEAEDITVRESEKAGLAVSADADVTVAVDTTITPELESEGLAREVIRRIQELRRTAGFELNDRIQVSYQASERLQQAIERMKQLIAGETLADSVEDKPVVAKEVQESYTIGQHQLQVGLRKV